MSPHRLSQGQWPWYDGELSWIQNVGGSRVCWARALDSSRPGLLLRWRPPSWVRSGPSCFTSHCKTKLYKILRGKQRQNTLCHKSQQDLFWPPPRIMKIRINKWDILKLKSFCAAKETINKTKRPSPECEKIFANRAIDKELISKTYTELM